MFPESPDCTLYVDTQRNGFWVTGGEPGVIEVLKVWKWPIVHRSKFWPIYAFNYISNLNLLDVLPSILTELQWKNMIVHNNELEWLLVGQILSGVWESLWEKV